MPQVSLRMPHVSLRMPQVFLRMPHVSLRMPPVSLRMPQESLACVRIRVECVRTLAACVRTLAACIRTRAACVRTRAACVRTPAACVRIHAACVRTLAACLRTPAACVRKRAACVRTRADVRRCAVRAGYARAMLRPEGSAGLCAEAEACRQKPPQAIRCCTGVKVGQGLVANSLEVCVHRLARLFCACCAREQRQHTQPRQPPGVKRHRAAPALLRPAPRNQRHGSRADSAAISHELSDGLCASWTA